MCQHLVALEACLSNVSNSINYSPIVIVARSAGLSIHIWHIERRRVPLKGGETGPARFAAAQLAG